MGECMRYIIIPDTNTNMWNCDNKYRIAGNFRGRKLTRISCFFWLFAKVFSVKYEGVVSFVTTQVSNPRLFSPRKFPGIR